MTNKFGIDGDETNDHGVSLWLYSFMGYIHKVDQINFQTNAPEKKMLQKTVETLFPLLEDKKREQLLALYRKRFDDKINNLM